MMKNHKEMREKMENDAWEEIDILRDKNKEELAKHIDAGMESKCHLTMINKDTFSALTKLRELKLVHNRLGFIDPDAFHGLVRLRELLLANNFLNDLEENTFAGLNSLLSLDLSYNKLQSLKNRSFNQLPNLNYQICHTME